MNFYINKGPSIPARNDAEWTGKLLKIPPVSPSIVSNLIRVEYFVKVSKNRFNF